MRVSIHSDRGELLWFRECLADQPFGMTSEAYLRDGTQPQIVSALKEALTESDGQLASRFEIPDVVTNVRLPTAQIDRCVPITRMRDFNPSRQHPVEAAVHLVPASIAKMLVIDVVHDPDVALMRAFHNDNVAGV